jgi:hypothetical protein
MNDGELVRRLHTLKVPVASDAARARSRHRALMALGQNEAPGQKAGTWRPWSVWGAACMALALVAAGFWAGQRHAAAENLAEDRKVLQQVDQLFPGQLNAVVEAKGKTDLSIGEGPMVGADQPVVVIFRRGNDRIRVLSYSGHRFCVDLGHLRSCFEILESPGGGIIVESDDNAWSVSQHPVIAGYSVQAQTLGASL